MLAVTALVAVWSLPSYYIEVSFPFRSIAAAPQEVLDLVMRLNQEGVSGLDPAELRWLYEWSAAHPLFGGFWRAQVSRAGLSAATVVMAILAALFFAWFRRPEHRPLIFQEAPKIFEDLRYLTSRLRLPFQPGIALREGFLDGEAVDGRDGPLIVLTGDRRWLERSWNDLSRAVLLHELGHVVNRDFRIREIVRWLWIVFAILAVGAALGLALEGSWAQLGAMSFRTSLLLAAAWWLWADMVRDREIYADQRAQTWGMGPALARRLSLPQSFGSREGDNEKQRWRSKLRQWLAGSRHPSNHERLAALTKPQQTFELSLELAFLTGLLLAVPVANLGSLASDAFLVVGLLGAPLFFLSVGAIPNASLLLIPIFGVFSVLFTVLALLVTGSLGIQVLRRALADRWQAVSPRVGFRRLLSLALCLGGGFQLGILPWIGLANVLRHWLSLLVFPIPAAALWLGATYSIGRWILGIRTGAEAPRISITAARWLSAGLLVLAAWPTVAYLTMDFLASIPETGVPAHWRLVFGGGLAIVGAFTAVVSLSLYAGLTRLFSHWRREPCSQCGRAPTNSPGIEGRCSDCRAPLASWLVLRPLELWDGLGHPARSEGVQ